MHELRKDILLSRWVEVLSDSKAPSEYDLPVNNDSKTESNCVLCPGRENETPPEITSIRKAGTLSDTPGWWVRALPSSKPFVSGRRRFRKKGGRYLRQDEQRWC
jgi:galactose-1-phosphate uridylyltransferase